MFRWPWDFRGSENIIVNLFELIWQMDADFLNNKVKICEYFKNSASLFSNKIEM